jgi:hypothetical protein
MSVANFGENFKTIFVKIIHIFVQIYKKLYKGKDSDLPRNVDIYQRTRRQYPDYINLELKMIFTYLDTRLCDWTLVSRNARTSEIYVNIYKEPT